nr:uncharacterized mitochondrial protein AtMg00810-like [Tanacetum cinerariifolium]
MALNHDSLSPAIQRQANISHADRTVTTSNELDFLFSLMFNELLSGSSKVVSKSSAVVSKSSAVSAADAPNQHQQPTTPLNNHTTPAPTCQTPPIATSVTSNENINQAEPHVKSDQVADDEFINIFSTPVQDQGETSSRHVDSSNMHTFYQCYPSEHRWTKDHPLEQVIGNPSQSVRTRCQLESDAEMCMFALTSTDHYAQMRGSRGSSGKTNAMKRILLFEIILVWWVKDMRKRKELILKNLLHPLLGWKPKKCTLINQMVLLTHIILTKFTDSRRRYMDSNKLQGRDTIHMGLWYPKDTGFELTAFSYLDHTGCLDSRKSTSGGIQLLGGDKLASWVSKKQDCTSISFTETEYVSLSACCAQVLWMRNQLTDYGFHFDKIPMYCDSKEP